MKLWSYYTNVYYKYIHGSFNIDNEIYYYFRIILHNISFIKIVFVGPKKPNLIPKIKCTMLLEQLYYMYYNTRPKNAPKGISVMCFHIFKFTQWLQIFLTR
jgi:hypothetical protein